MKLLVTAVALALGTQLVAAEDLLQVYELARQNDPQLAAASANRDAVLEARPLARSQLLPNVGLSADLTWQDQDVSGGAAALFPDGSSTNRGAAVTLVQPLYRRDRLLQLEQADSQIAQAEADYVVSEQGLALRVAQAYFRVLAAQDNLGFAQSEEKAIERQLDQAKQRFEVGLIAITDVHEAQARFDQARADEINARNLLDNSWEALREIVGPELPADLAPLQAQIPLDLPAPADLDEWSEQALRNNPGVQSAQQAVETARTEIEVQRSGHFPAVDMVGAYQLSRSSEDRDVDTTSLGVQLAVPLYAGGGISAATRQARHNLTASQDVLDQQRRAVDRQVRDAYRGVESTISRVQALQATTVSAQSALDATTAGFDVGTRTLVDVLNSQRDLFDAQRNYALARYDYVLTILTLEQAAGTLDAEDVTRVNAWLE